MSIAELQSGEKKTYLRLFANSIDVNTLAVSSAIVGTSLYASDISTWKNWQVQSASAGALTAEQIFGGAIIFSQNLVPFNLSLPTKQSMFDFLSARGISLSELVGKSSVVNYVNFNIVAPNNISYNALDWEFGVGANPIVVSPGVHSFWLLSWNSITGKFRLD